MKLLQTLSSMTMLAIGSVAMAHTHLTQSAPAEGAVVSPGPTQIVLTFAEPALVTALWLQQDAGPRQKLGPVPTEAQATITVATPALKPGRYVVTWRAVSADRHVMSGQVHFSVT